MANIIYQTWNKSVTLLLAVLLQHKVTFFFIFQTFLKLTTRSFTINTTQFTVSNNGTQWILDFGPDSVVLSVNDLDENLTISSLENPLAAWSLLLSQRQEFWTITCFEFPLLPTNREHLRREKSTLQCWSTRYRHWGLRAIRIRRHWLQLGRSYSGYGNVCLGIVDCSLYTRRVMLKEDYHNKRMSQLAYAPFEYNYMEALAKTIINPAGQNQFIQENIFNNAPIRRKATAMNSNSAIAGSFAENPFWY